MRKGKGEDEVARVPELVVQEEPKKRWVSYIWDTFDKSPEERRFLFKIDAAILTFASLGMLSTKPHNSSCSQWLLGGKLTREIEGYFIKYLDQININNAFVSGMSVSDSGRLHLT